MSVVRGLIRKPKPPDDRPCTRCGGKPRHHGQTTCLRCTRELARESRMRSPGYRLLYHEKDRPCVDCGIRLPPEVMEFDHVRGEKKFALTGPNVRTRTLEEVEAEIAKCEVRCPNCHRMRHYWDWRSP